MKERAVQFGTDVVHTGILCEPIEASAEARNRPVVLLLNAGLIHRVGPNRLHVNLARALAAAGYTSLRFDMSGRGDTDVRRDAESFINSGIRETQSAMDYLQQVRGTNRFVPMGICSGAHDAVRTALLDERIVGSVLIEFYVYPTSRHRRHHYVRRLANPKSWANTIAGRNPLGQSLWYKLGLRAEPPAVKTAAEQMNEAEDGFIMPQKEVEASLKGLADRGMELCFVFAGASGMCAYERQVYDAYPALSGHDHVHVEYFGGADHTFTRLHFQQRLLDAIIRWMPATDVAGLKA